PVQGLQGRVALIKSAGNARQMSEAELQQLVCALANALSDPDTPAHPNDLTVAHLSMMTLRNLGPSAKGAVPAVRTALTSNDTLLRGYGIITLASIETDRTVAIPALLEVLQFKDISDRKKIHYLRKCVIAALGEVAGPE